MRSLVLKARRIGRTEDGVISKLTDDNYLYRDGKITIEELVSRAEMVRVRWQATCEHMFENIRIAYADDDAPSNTQYCPTGQGSKNVAERKRSTGSKFA